MKLKLLFLSFLFVLSSYSQRDSYSTMKSHLDGISDLIPGRFTYFRGIDYNFANWRFQSYLQDDYMHLTFALKNSYVEGENIITQRFTPKVSNGKEYLKVIYYTKNDKTKVPWLPSENGCVLIRSVEMIGTTNIVIRIFLNYWPQKINLGGYKQGEIASFQIMGDYVSLIGISPQVYKILISHGNIEADYYKTFKIE